VQGSNDGDQRRILASMRGITARIRITVKLHRKKLMVFDRFLV
jgi:hypothetical protein